MANQGNVLVTGAGGFIGHHLVSYLVERGYRVRGVDIKEPEFEPTRAHEFQVLDLRYWENCLRATEGIDEVYGLAADMGGIGYIETNKAAIIDPGGDLNKLKKAVADRNLELQAIWLTHAHIDHAGGVAELLKPAEPIFCANSKASPGVKW